MRGRAIRLSKPRRMVIDLLHFARKLPTLPVQRRVDIAALVAARAACRERPQWTAIFTKAYALASDEFPALRRAYVAFPWPRLYEYPISTASIAFERDYQGEPSLFFHLFKDPAARSLTDLGREIRRVANAPIAEIKEFRRALYIAGLPRPLRRLAWWVGLNLGRQRGNHFGTFGVSVYSALSAESLHPLSPLTTLLNYGVIGDDGSVDVRIVYDHRVMDGATIARVLARLGEILTGPLVDEIKSLEQAP
ncbi:MAG: hypothetical protein ACR2K5_10090 [Pseudolabrys sp.]